MSHNFPKLHYLLLTCLVAGMADVAEAGSVQFSTYYPAPFGMYDRLRLVPRTGLTPPCDPGTLYINNEAGNQLEVCNAAGNAWAPLSGGPWTQDVNGVYVTDITANVGIGTTAPQAKFHVDVNSDTSGSSNLEDDFIVGAEGGVGIGTTPLGGAGGAALYIKEGPTERLAKIVLQRSSTAKYLGIDFRRETGATEWSLMPSIEGGGSPSSFEIWEGGSSRRFVIKNATGNVGIGTADPKGSLHILDKTGIPSGPVVGLLIERDSNFNGAPRMVLVDTALGAVTTAPSWNIDNTLDQLRIFRQPNIATAGPPCLTISNALNVGIGTDTPEFKLSMENDGGILSKGIFDSGATLATSGAGTRLIWYPRKAAFRMGQVTGTQWNNANIGTYSVAMGYDEQASGTGSVALGTTNTASGVGSFALGGSLTVAGDYSAAIGRNITLPAAADYSFALGYEINATNPVGFGIGAYLTSGATGAAVLGSGVNTANRLVNNTATSLAIGFNSNIPTLFIGPSSGVGTTGNVGIGTTAPGTNKLEVVGGPIKATGGFILETRTTNPGAPVNGQMWLCTDTGDATPCNGI